MKKYSDLVQDAHDGSCGYRPTRIAIIDTGMVDIRPDTDNIEDLTIDRHQLETHRIKERREHRSRRLIDETLWSRIKKRRYCVKKKRSRIRKRLSLVGDDDSSNRRFLASDAHGIQMARIIGSIDPCCVFYIARVSSRRSGITPAGVAEVGYSRLHSLLRFISVFDFINLYPRQYEGRYQKVLMLSP